MQKRTPIALLFLSAVGLSGIVGHEYYSEKAIQPLPGDRWTYGFGSTFKTDGTPVKKNDTIKPVEALRLTIKHIRADEEQLKKCLDPSVELFQHEYDAYESLGYSVGAPAVCKSSIPKKLKDKEYAEACKAILSFNKFRDCTKPKVLDPKTGQTVCPLVVIKGLDNRRKDEYKTCMGESK